MKTTPFQFFTRFFCFGVAFFVVGCAFWTDKTKELDSEDKLDDSRKINERLELLVEKSNVWFKSNLQKTHRVECSNLGFVKVSERVSAGKVLRISFEWSMLCDFGMEVPQFERIAMEHEMYIRNDLKKISP